MEEKMNVDHLSREELSQLVQDETLEEGAAEALRSYFLVVVKIVTGTDSLTVPAQTPLDKLKVISHGHPHIMKYLEAEAVETPILPREKLLKTFGARLEDVAVQVQIEGFLRGICDIAESYAEPGPITKEAMELAINAARRP